MVGDPSCIPAAPRPLGNYSGLGTGLVCISVLIPSHFPQRALPKKCLRALRSHRFPRVSGGAKPTVPLCPAALGFGCRAGERRGAQLSAVSAAAAAWQRTFPDAPLPCSQQGFLPRVRQSFIPGWPAQPGSLAVTSSSRCSAMAGVQLRHGTRSAPGSLPPLCHWGHLLCHSEGLLGIRWPGVGDCVLDRGGTGDAVGWCRLAVTPGPPPWGPWHPCGATARSCAQAPARHASRLRLTGNRMNKISSPSPLLLPLLLRGLLKPFAASRQLGEPGRPPRAAMCRGSGLRAPRRRLRTGASAAVPWPRASSTGFPGGWWETGAAEGPDGSPVRV